MASRLRSIPPSVSFLKEDQLRSEHFDLVVLCGGDGTMLHISSLFQGRPCPPILPFALGSLGFMTTFDFFDHPIILNRLLRGKLNLMKRDRFHVKWNQHQWDILNEALLHRSATQKAMPEFEFRLGNDDFSFPTAIADGLLLATPSGSSGHSLSAGGPLVHPGLHGVSVLNMISPRTMAFRPLIVPLQHGMTVGLADESRAGEVDVILDGRTVGVLRKNDRIEVKQSDYPLPVYNLFGETEDWNLRLTRSLKWCQSFRNSSH